MGTPILAMAAKREPRENTAEDVPIIAGVAILDMMIQKIYPKKSDPKVSMYIYMAPVATTCLLNFYHHIFQSTRYILNHISFYLLAAAIKQSPSRFRKAKLLEVIFSIRHEIHSFDHLW